MGRVADATVPAPRRSDDAIAVAMARSSNNGDGGRGTATLQRVRLCHKWWWAQLYSFNSLLPHPLTWDDFRGSPSGPTDARRGGAPQPAGALGKR